ncbi:pilus assembly protein FimV [Shewanella colwelliana]|uniref:FimV/HubP family polar landmark protein n=1 Tax=Shewanella colwelliana TaxID=23 RepID=UPI001BBE484C|nr:FimV/HubP family polar landmark protein [Shewanella colwelliana]GIU28142.1 pilus assembly protein FimV [Shewanella colwelliana]
MNFRTSHLVGIIASALVILTSTTGLLSAAEPLKITGPDGESRQVLRQYGPTTAADTFWSIAQKTRPDASVSIYQVMAAIYDANPHAFSSDNYNSLERGMILLIPAKEVMQAIPNSLAKQQAQQSDKGWKQTAKSPVAKADNAKPVPVPEAVVNTPALPTVSVQVQQQVEELTAKLEAEQAKSLSLTDELARAQDKLDLNNNDANQLQGRIDELTAKVAELEEALLIQKEQKAVLTSEFEALRQEKTMAQEVVEPPSDDWQTMMSNPLYLAVAAAIPAFLLLMGIWFALRRRSDKQATQAGETEKPIAEPAPISEANEQPVDEASAMAVHLDTEDESDSLDSLMSVDASQLAPEADLTDDSDQLDMAQDMVIEADEPAEDVADEEGQSLDDLWAEAMGEQEEDELNANQEDDLDSLLADLDTPAEAVDSSAEQEDDLDSLLADLDTPAEKPSTAAESEDDLDSLLADFDSQDTPEATDDTDLDALLNDLDRPQDSSEETAVESEAQEEDLDALLAEFDLPKMSEAAADEQTDEDLSESIAAELDDQSETSDEQADLDSLLAEFESTEIPASDDKSALSSDTDNEDLSEQIAAELDAQPSVSDSDAVEDLDQLLAEFETPTESESHPPEADSEDISELIAAELDAEIEADVVSDDDLDSLLADLEQPATEPATEADDTCEVVEADVSEISPDEAASDDELDTLLADLDKVDTPQSSEAESDAPLEADDVVEVDLAGSSDDVALDALLADLESADGGADKSARDSGFFNDLKGSKRADENVLEWDSAAMGDLALDTDTKAVSHADADDADDELSLNIEDDDNLTVDQALAALDAQELKKQPARAVNEHDLTAFQQDNGFIDIDRLLNDADEDVADVDQYKELDVDMGELDDLMGSASMVDVDDEENSVNAKLDLARAYIEIDDVDSAKALLKEVELDGNDRQQEEAQGLLKEL